MRNPRILSVGLYNTKIVSCISNFQTMKRLNVYIDGFNLYFGMVDAGFTNCKWLDIHLLANNLKESGHQLKDVKYFTSRITNNPDKQQRQSDYLDALGTTPVSIIYGQFRNRDTTCNRCGHIWADPKEKMTDVNIATQLMVDAFKDEFDVAFLISGDSDLVPPLKSVRSLFPKKEVWIVFPPKRESYELKNNASGSFVIGRKKLESSQLPGVVTSKYGVDLKRPDVWQ